MPGESTNWLPPRAVQASTYTTISGGQSPAATAASAVSGNGWRNGAPVAPHAEVPGEALHHVDAGVPPPGVVVVAGRHVHPQRPGGAGRRAGCRPAPGWSITCSSIRPASGADHGSPTSSLGVAVAVHRRRTLERPARAMPRARGYERVTVPCRKEPRRCWDADQPRRRRGPSAGRGGQSLLAARGRGRPRRGDAASPACSTCPTGSAGAAATRRPRGDVIYEGQRGPAQRQRSSSSTWATARRSCRSRRSRTTTSRAGSSTATSSRPTAPRAWPTRPTASRRRSCGWRSTTAPARSRSSAEGGGRRAGHQVRDRRAVRVRRDAGAHRGERRRVPAGRHADRLPRGLRELRVGRGRGRGGGVAVPDRGARAVPDAASSPPT